MSKLSQKIKTLLQSELDLSGDQINKLENLDLTLKGLNPELEKNCMIGQTWFMEGSSLNSMISYAETVYEDEAIAQNSKIEFGTHDNENWFAHNVPYFGKVQISKFTEHGITEFDIHFNDCWQGPFPTQSKCIRHLEDCIAEQRKEEKVAQA